MSGDQQQELERLLGRVAEIEAANRRYVIRDALALAVSQSGVPLKPNVERQLAELLLPMVVAAVPKGPVAINNEWLRQTLAQPAWAHFRADGGEVAAPVTEELADDRGNPPPKWSPPTAVGPSPAGRLSEVIKQALATSPANPPPDVPSGQASPPTESLGDAIVREAGRRQAAVATDATQDMSVPLGMPPQRRGFIAPGRLPM